MITKTCEFTGLTAEFTLEGMIVFWDQKRTKIQLIEPFFHRMTESEADSTVIYQSVTLTLRHKAFGFTDQDLRHFGFAEAISLPTRLRE